MAMQVGAPDNPFIPTLRRGTQIILPNGTPPVTLGVNPTAPAPTPGSVGIGELLIDAQSRTMWLGVDIQVDINQALLVADIAACFANDVTTLTTSKAYTDEQIQTRAPTVHTHDHTAITDWDAAVNNSVKQQGSSGLVVGMIMLWSGTLTDVGVGQLADWWPCNGQKGTQDLRDKFIIGAGGTRPPGTNNPGGASSATGLAGAHTPYCNYHTLSTTEMPGHSHVLNDPGHTHVVNDDGHKHTTYAAGPTGLPFGYGAGTIVAYGNTYTSVNTCGIYLTARATGCSIQAAGGGGAHSHVMNAVPDHTHTVPAAINQLPFFALAFIQKVS